MYNVCYFIFFWQVSSAKLKLSKQRFGNLNNDFEYFVYMHMIALGN
jgi:hypothetical protein